MKNSVIVYVSYLKYEDFISALSRSGYGDESALRAGASSIRLGVDVVFTIFPDQKKFRLELFDAYNLKAEMTSDEFIDLFL